MAAAPGSSPSGLLSLQLEHVSLLAVPPPPSCLHDLLAAASDDNTPEVRGEEAVADGCILSQDFFSTPDYITPDAPTTGINFSFDSDKANLSCPKSPVKSKNPRIKRFKRDFADDEQEQDPNTLFEVSCKNVFDEDERLQNGSRNKSSYITPSVVALRSRVMPPPCIENPYLRADSSITEELFCGSQSKSLALQSAGFSRSYGGDNISRYRTDFHELEQIGLGNFSRVYKVLNRIDGCIYAVKKITKQLYNDQDRTQALTEVQALAALGSHENVVRYYSSWFENEQLHIQMEICESSLSVTKNSPFKCAEALKMLYQVSSALDFIHEHGIVHLDVKPENIYIKNGSYKLGDFGCATLMDGTLCIEEGDSRYLPLEMLNDKYEHLDKVDIFSLGAAVYELVRGTPLPKSGPQFVSLREGKITLLPCYPIQLQNLLKSMLDPDPLRRPSARELINNPIFEKLHSPAMMRALFPPAKLAHHR